MATLAELSTIANNANFQSRVSMAMTTAAVNVYAEATNTVGHPARVVFAKSVFNGGYSPAATCMMVLTNATIAAEANVATTPGFAIPDGDIQFAVNSLWNAFSGV